MTVLVLNQDYAVLAVARVPRALALLSGGKAELLEAGVIPIRSPSCSLPRPSVIRLTSYVKRPRPHVRFSRHNVFKRDGYTCQYCGKVRPRDLTIDHVMPRHRGGPDAWTNVVAACRPCNHKKGGRTPTEAHMVLRSLPYEPRITSYLHLIAGHEQPEWAPFLGVAV